MGQTTQNNTGMNREESIYDRFITKLAAGKTLRFPIYMSEMFMRTPLEELELSQRAYHCLKRRGFDTVGDLVEHINSENDLLAIRNMGKLSAREVIKSLMEYQYSTLTTDKQKAFVERVVELNE